MQLYISNKDESIRVFRNPVLEYFTHAYPATPVIVYIPIACYLAFTSSAGRSAAGLTGLFITGVFLWTFMEYVMHRWVFHLDSDTKIGRKLHLIFHKTHHDYPRDSTRLVLPLFASLPLGIIFYCLFLLIFRENSNILYAGFLSGYVVYDCIHYTVHSKILKSSIGRYMKHYHILHHYSDYNTAFGVSSPLWDFIFGTLPVRKQQLTTTKNIRRIKK